MIPNEAMLRLARQRRRLQQADAAALLGVDQSLVSRMENGVVEVRDEWLLKAARAYGVPLSFFYQQDTVYGAPVSVHPMWRKKADVPARELDGVVAELNIRVVHLRRLLEGVEVANTTDMPRLDIEEFGSPEGIAALVRAHWRLPSGPIKNLTLHAEKAGVIVAHSLLGGASISGVTFAPPGMPPLVVLNSNQPADRMRFTLAHELAHMVMHRFPTPNMEQEANEFAVALLMPRSDITPYLAGRKIELSTLAALKPEWKVSMASMLMRARSLNFIESGPYTYLWKQMSARGYRLREPPELDFPNEKPELLSRIIGLHLESFGYSTADLAKVFCIHEAELVELYGLGDNEPQRAKLTVLK